MNVNLLYKDREWVSPEYYFDEKTIETDLGLETIFSIASKPVIYRNDEVEKIGTADLYIASAMRRIMLTPLHSAEQIYYRQEICKDATGNEQLIISIYDTVTNMLDVWDKLGRHVNNKNTGRDNVTKLVTKIHEFRLFKDTLSSIKKLFSDNEKSLKSEGLQNFYMNLCESYNNTLEEDLNVLSDALEFYITEKASAEAQFVKVPKVVLEGKIGAGCKLDSLHLMEAATVDKKYRDPKSTLAKVRGYLDSLTPDSVAADGEINAQKQASKLEYEVASYLCSFTESFMREYETFFDRLRFQISFYRGIANLHHHFKRFHTDYSYPVVGEKNCLKFSELKEFVMSIEQRVDAVGNTCEISPKNLIIITGANQGGKSTFLRSIGIAQVMLQCGMPVAATYYESGLFPSLFMHFTRREDSEMNSGRLDEELYRMNQIIKNLGPDSLILLNESFATTTEKDGSEIAYGIIKALCEAGVKIITVTHLLSFAQRMHKESTKLQEAGEESGIEFLSAERLKDGKRTFHMIQSVPELTSFGLDLFDKIIKCD